MVTMTEEKLYTVPEIAERLRISRFTVLNWLRAGRLQGFRPGGTRIGWRVRESDFDRFVEQLARGERPEEGRGR